MSTAISGIPEILAELRAGRMVILVDEEDRENEGDLLMAAEFVTPDAINFMAKHGRHAQHAHFHCNGCGIFSCLDDSATPRVRLPRGYRGQAIDITVQGLCGACAG